MGPMRIILEEPRTVGATITLAGVLEGAGAPQRLWWEVPREWGHALDLSADPFVTAFMMPMMQVGGAVRIEGRVSPSLLMNLERFAAIWRSWAPERYKPVTFETGEEVEAPAPASEAFIVPFSCGVDSCYTLWRHVQQRAGRRTRGIGAAMLMHGFDIWLDQPHSDAIFAGLERSARAMLDSVNVPLIVVKSNFHELSTYWAYSFGTQLIGGLRLFGRHFGGTLIPNSYTYDRMAFVWGSHPLSDQELSSRRFAVEDDGGEVTRFDKLAAIADWPAAMANLRVCFGAGANTHENCSVCEKCYRTILACRIAGLPLPSAFKQDVRDRDLRRFKVRSEHTLVLWGDLYDSVVARGLQHERWAKALRRVYRRSRRRVWLQKLTRPFVPVRNAMRVLFRGSAKSKRELGSV